MAIVEIKLVRELKRTYDILARLDKTEGLLRLVQINGYHVVLSPEFVRRYGHDFRNKEKRYDSLKLYHADLVSAVRERGEDISCQLELFEKLKT